MVGKAINGVGQPQKGCGFGSDTTFVSSEQMSENWLAFAVSQRLKTPILRRS